MAEWIYRIHPSREDFATTMTPEEAVVWGVHFAADVPITCCRGSVARPGPCCGLLPCPPQVVCDNVEPAECQRLAAKEGR